MSYGDTITYSIKQQVNTLNVNCISRYTSLKFTDYLPTGLTPQVIKVYYKDSLMIYCTVEIDSSGSATLAHTYYISPWSSALGLVYYFTSTREVRFVAGSTFLNSTLSLAGEYIEVQIQAQLTSSTVSQLSNTATWYLSDVPVNSNTVITPCVAKTYYYVYYYRESSSGGWERVYTQSVTSGQTLYVQSAATTEATRSNCAGFSGWYFSDPANSGASKISSGSYTVSGNVYLYGRNYCTVTYQTASNAFAKETSAVQFYSDEQLSTMATFASTYPSSQTVYWGKTVSVGGSKTLYYASGARVKRAKSCSGAYVNDSSATGTQTTSVKISSNTVLYKTWSGPTYDGVIASR
jgi:fimbrial isopeptide formation D2 family protein